MFVLRFTKENTLFYEKKHIAFSCSARSFRLFLFALLLELCMHNRHYLLVMIVTPRKIYAINDRYHAVDDCQDAVSLVHDSGH